MRVRFTLAALVVVVAPLAGCGRDAGPATVAPAGIDAELALPPASPAVAVDPSASDPAAPDAVAAAAPAGPAAPAVGPATQELEQPAIWPAADVVFATPEEAATDFVANVLITDGDPLLGEFQRGDSRSGEIAVLFGGEDGTADPPLEKGLLLLRQLGPDDGWFVIAAISDGATIDSPDAGDAVDAGPVTVSGEGRGFESTLVVSAFPPGDVAARFDQEIGAGGAFDELEPYSVTLDLSAAAPGETVVILVHGDTGLGSDPSTFAALPVVIQQVIPPTR